jgi:hypothetical protein
MVQHTTSLTSSGVGLLCEVATLNRVRSFPLSRARGLPFPYRFGFGRICEAGKDTQREGGGAVCRLGGGMVRLRAGWIISTKGVA